MFENERLCQDRKRYFKYYAKHSLDDTKYIPVVKIIINSIERAMKADGFENRDIKSVEEELVQLNMRLYIERWLRQAKEDEEFPDSESETEAAQYYFEYILEHEEHPR